MIKTIRGLGAKGLILDQEPYDIPMAALSNGNNIRIDNGKIASATGWQEFKHPDLTGKVYRHISGWFPQAGYSLVAIESGNWYRFIGRDVPGIDVTPTGTVNDGVWSSSPVGDSLIITNGADAPWIMNPTDSRFATLPNWPTSTSCRKLKYYNGYLIATGLIENGVEAPYVVRWSDALIPGQVNPSWDYTVTTNLAGRNELSGNDGPILDLEQLGDQMLIYMRNGVYSMQYIGGTFVFSFRKLFDDDGIINPGAVASFAGGHLVVGNNDIYVTDGTSKRSISDGRVTNHFYATLADPTSVKVIRHTPRDEIWICYSDGESRADYNRNPTIPFLTPDGSRAMNRALVYNYQYDAWTQQDLDYFIDATIGPRFDTDIELWGDDASNDGTWAGSSGRWSTINPIDTDTAPYFMRYTVIYEGDKNYFFKETNENQSGPGAQYYSGPGGLFLRPISFIEQTKLDLDELFGETQSMKRVQRILPQVGGTGDVDLSVGYSNTPNGSITYKPSVRMSIENEYKVDIRAQGRYLSIKMEKPEGEATHFSINGWDLDLERGHGR